MKEEGSVRERRNRVGDERGREREKGIRERMR